jgi:hypothetical protein
VDLISVKMDEGDEGRPDIYEQNIIRALYQGGGYMPEGFACAVGQMTPAFSLLVGTLRDRPRTTEHPVYCVLVSVEPDTGFHSNQSVRRSMVPRGGIEPPTP